MTKPNLMDFIPVHHVNWEKDQDNHIVIFSPKSKYKWIRALIKRFNIDPYYKIHLDEYGSFIWELMDGKQSVFQLCNQLKNQFGSQVEPVYERGGLLIKSMASNGFIQYQS